MKLILITLGFILAGIGIFGFIFPDVSYDTTKSLFEFGNFKAAVDATEIIHIPQIFSSASLGLGLLLLIFGFLKKR